MESMNGHGKGDRGIHWAAVPMKKTGSSEGTDRAKDTVPEMAPRVEETGVRRRLPRAVAAMLAGLCLTLLQVAAVMVLAPAAPGSAAHGWSEQGARARYGAFFQHDSFWFENIVTRGYASIIPPPRYKSFDMGNVAFFPAYPIFGGWLARQTGLGLRTSLLLASQLAAWAFWSYAVAFLLRWRVPLIVGAAALAAIAVHPAAFFLVAAYSESLFLAALLGFLYWSARPGAGAALLAAAHGFGMTATRIAGIPCVAAEGLARIGGDAGQRNRGFWARLAALERPILVGLVSVLGTLLFFAFCQAHFGSWDFYMQTQAAGWGVHPLYLEPFRWANYAPFWPDWRDPQELSRFSVGITLWMFAGVALAEWRAWRVSKAGKWAKLRRRLAFYFCAAAIFYISVAGVASVHFDSMIRYQFCTHLLVALAAADLWAQAPPRSGLARVALVCGLLVFLAAGGWVQAHYAAVFTSGGWFA